MKVVNCSLKVAPSIWKSRSENGSLAAIIVKFYLLEVVYPFYKAEVNS